MKKTVSCIMAVVIILISFSVPVYASDYSRGSTILAGELYIVVSFDCTSSGNFTGHAFIMYYNSSDYTVDFGSMTLKPGEEVTVSTTGVETGWYRVWYNLDSYHYHHNNELHDNVYAHTTITYDQLFTIQRIIDAWDEYEALTNNCTHFATAIWNAVSSEKLNASFPITLQSQIKKLDHYYTNLSLATQSNIGYFKDGVFKDVY